MGGEFLSTHGRRLSVIVKSTMKILLISPGRPDDIDTRVARAVPYLGTGALFAPHAVAAVAALTPPGHEVHIHDEHQRGPADSIIASGTYDIIGITVTSNQLPRVLTLGGLARSHRPEAKVVAGGIGAQRLVETPDHPFDVVFFGEAEDTWPEFLGDLAAGRQRRIYQRLARPDLAKVPTPRWDLIREDMPLYGNALVQTTRGCPFDCSFCDVTYTYGRTPRSKPVDHVLEEIRLLESLGVRMIFLADDNFAAKRTYAKQLLREMIALNQSFRAPITFMTQVDITVAEDDELLELMADCNFAELMIGVESVDEDALRDLNKQQNLRVDAVAAVRKIQSYGIAVLAHMIIGSDSDDTAAFARTAEFVRQAHILHHYCHPLMAPPGTRLWYELAAAGRIVDPPLGEGVDIVSNIVPQRMTRVELLEGLADYWLKIHEPARYLACGLGFLDDVKRRPRVPRAKGRGFWRHLKLVGRVFWYYCFEVSAAQRRVFFKLLVTAARRASYLVDKVIFLYTCYMMDHLRALHDAEVARRQAAAEREHPLPATTTRLLPVPFAVRRSAREILAIAYARVRRTIGRKESLYRVVVEAIGDFAERHGREFELLDEGMRLRIEECCDRALAGREGDYKNELPSGEPPPGFTREILDALDSSIRMRQAQNRSGARQPQVSEPMATTSAEAE